MLPQGGHYSSFPTVFSVFNNLTEVVSQLPRLPTTADFAFLKHSAQVSPIEYRYRPYYVVQALRWLLQNNFLYEGKVDWASLENDLTWNPTDRELYVDVPFIATVPEDYEGMPEPTEQGPAANPGAPTMPTQEVHLELPEEGRSLVDQLRDIAFTAEGRQSVTMVRNQQQYTPDHATDHFLPKAFAGLYPYGRGGPDNSSDKTSKFVMSEGYFQHMINLGGQRLFQQQNTFVFFALSWLMKKRVGTVTFLSSRNAGDADAGEDNITVKDVRDLLSYLETAPAGDPLPDEPTLISQNRVRALMRRLQPFANALPGTPLYFQQCRNRLLAMISSPATTTMMGAQWRWFYTMAQPDLYLAEIYDNAITSAMYDTGIPLVTLGLNASIDERRKAVNALTYRQRGDILRRHPAISARIFALMQDAIHKHILCGKDQPFGEITDYFAREEEQARGCPHGHHMLAVRVLDGISAKSISSTSPEEQAKVIALINATLTACLQARGADDTSDWENYTPEEYAHVRTLETDYNYNVVPSTVTKDSCHPCRERFDATLDYSYRNGGLKSDVMRKTIRRHQLVNQMHSCRASCWKKCEKGALKVCRYGYVQQQLPNNDKTAVIEMDEDALNRIRYRAMPQRNNGNINVCPISPLVNLTTRGNVDFQYICNVYGALEYVSKYVSKAEAPDCKLLQNCSPRRWLILIFQTNS